MPYVKRDSSNKVTGVFVRKQSFVSELLPEGHVDLVEFYSPDPKRARDLGLSSMVHTFADGSVIQVRPQDYQYLSLAIQRGLAIDWVLEDNTVRLTSVQELTEALDSGVQKGIVIWSTYTEVLKNG